MAVRFTALLYALLPLTVSVLDLAACDSKTAITRRVEAADLPVVADGHGLLFSFFDRHAQLRTVGRMADVEPTGRSAVMVTVPSRRLSGDRIFVADLREKSPGGQFLCWIEPRSRWLERTMPQVSYLSARRNGPPKTAVRSSLASAKETTKPTPKVASRVKRPPTSGVHRRRRRHRLVRKRRHGAAKKRTHQPAKKPMTRAEAFARASQDDADDDGFDRGNFKIGTPVAPKTALVSAPKKKAVNPVLLFATRWCPSCRAAKAFLRRLRVPFVELDVERDPDAARRYQAVAQAAGIRTGAVPVLVIAGRVYQGFSRLQIHSALVGAKLIPTT